MLQKNFGNKPEITLRGGGPKRNDNGLSDNEKQMLKATLDDQAS